MKHRIIITGGRGFIGSELAQQLKVSGCDVLALTRENCDYIPATISSLVKQYQPDAFIHAAGNSSVSFSCENPEAAKENTVVLTQKVLQGIAYAKIPLNFIYLSSAAVYGNPELLPISENMPLKPISTYGRHKLQCEELVQHCALIHDFITPVIVRIFSLFGPMQKRLVLYELFLQFQDNQRKNITIRGTGLETRDYLPIDIFVKKLSALIYTLDDKKPKNIPIAVNIASGESHTILECAQIMARLLNSSKPVFSAKTGIAGNPDHWTADTTVYNQIVKSIFPFDFELELAKTLDQWKRQETC